MPYSTSFTVESARLLSQDEIDRVIENLRTKAKRSLTALLNLAIFRLSTFAGLRASEIANVRLADVVLDAEQPFIRIRGEIAKNGKSRITPIWSAGAVEDLKAWRNTRKGNGASDSDPLIASTHSDSKAIALNRSQIRKHFITAVKVLGSERQRTLTTHCGRHTLCSMALAKGVPIVEVKNAMGHSDISITNLYAGKFRSGKTLQYSID